MMNRTFRQEAKAMDNTIKALYEEKKYLEQEVADHNRQTDRIRLQMVLHFISIYEK